MSPTTFSVSFQQVLDRITPHLPPYLRKIEPVHGRVCFEFAPFTGLEKEPTTPKSYYDDPRLDYVAESQDAAEYRIRTIASDVLGDLYEQAAREWPAAISRLVDAQDAALAAAAAFDSRAIDIADVHYKHLYADLSQDQALAKAGYPEAKDWHVGDGFGGYFRDGLAEKVTGLIEQQDAHLAKVGRLSGTTH
ncbi:hypothetical protein CJI59_22095 [Streptomyces sp. Alain-F2R5]|nr:hypothetical protein [Streptomyces sp. Alain-F2R5]PAM99593.1 hypothetical protein CJI59_22095 [Streptomyces sp. Alain-F2R5]